jgi:catechol 2,3-dioxygenase-like lactoylglutathione lyase family enzyme
MIIGLHAILYSKDPEADRAFFRDVLGFEGVDIGRGWLIFRMPPAELAFHPVDDEEMHEVYLMCDDIRSTLSDLEKKNVICSQVHEERWGSLITVTLPGGGKLGIYEPKHALAIL